MAFSSRSHSMISSSKSDLSNRASEADDQKYYKEFEDGSSCYDPNAPQMSARSFVVKIRVDPESKRLILDDM